MYFTGGSSFSGSAGIMRRQPHDVRAGSISTNAYFFCGKVNHQDAKAPSSENPSVYLWLWWFFLCLFLDPALGGLVIARLGLDPALALGCRFALPERRLGLEPVDQEAA